VNQVRAGTKRETDTAPHLSERELQVLTLVAAGLSNPEIGTRLFISAATVKTHLLRIFDKLEVRDRTHAVTRAQQLGVLTLGPD
jgi:ATP/maltotriose-dependent transcriptional regulator MalT